MFLEIVLAALTNNPQPSPSPLRTIVNSRITPFCTAFTQNIRYSVQGILLNDSLFERTEPVFLKAAHDMMNSGVDRLSSGANRNPESAATVLDMNRLQEIGGSIVHNLQTINDILNDGTRFPKQPGNPQDAQLVQLRAQLLAIAKKQNDELNIISGTTAQYMFDTLYNSDVSMGGALAANGKALPNVGTLSGGPLKGKASAGDPVLMRNDLFMDSPMGRMYRLMAEQRSEEASMQPEFTKSLLDASQNCRQ